MTRIYKLLSHEEWMAAQAVGRFEGSAVDLADGFIHFSTAEQLAETARRHFAGRADLVCLVVDGADFPKLRWETSRGGALFPHLYAALDPAMVVASWPVRLGEDGAPVIELERG